MGIGADLGAFGLLRRQKPIELQIVAVVDWFAHGGSPLEGRTISAGCGIILAVWVGIK
jgi:hypothetical protein